MRVIINSNYRTTKQCPNGQPTTLLTKLIHPIRQKNPLLCSVEELKVSTYKYFKDIERSSL
jgi:hypothetical protein